MTDFLLFRNLAKYQQHKMKKVQKIRNLQQR